MASESGNTKGTSREKVEANQRNAQLSTGPTSAEGKKNSSRSALKHGLLAKDVVITTRGNKEDPAEFDALLADLRGCYQPIDVAEDLLVRELAVSYWRSSRALRYERGEVTCADAAPDDSELSGLEITILELQPIAEAYHSLLRSSRGIKFLLRKIEEAQEEVRVSGFLSRESRRWLAPENKWDRIAHLGKTGLLAALEKEAEELTARKGQVEDNASQWRNVRRDCSAIPPKNALDRLDRYETRNVRHRYKVEARLAELQARPGRNAKLKSGGDGVAESDQDIQFCQTNPTGSGEPQVGEAKARVAQEESGAPPAVDPIASPTTETVAAESDVAQAEQTPCPNDAHTSDWTDGDGAENRSDEPDETGEA
jgi:hypothetical protein